MVFRAVRLPLERRQGRAAISWLNNLVSIERDTAAPAMDAACAIRVAELVVPARLIFPAQHSPDLIGQICAPSRWALFSLPATLPTAT